MIRYIITNNDPRYRESDLHYEYCKKHGMPFIIIQDKGKKRYLLHWDSYPIGNRFFPGADFHNRVKKAMEKYITKKPVSCGTVGYIEKLSLDDARDAAETIYNLFAMETGKRHSGEVH